MRRSVLVLLLVMLASAAWAGIGGPKSQSTNRRGDLHFAVLGDVHAEADAARALRLASYLKAQQIPYVLLGGDCSLTSVEGYTTYAAFMDSIRSYGGVVYSCVGNHDSDWDSLYHVGGTPAAADSAYLWDLFGELFPYAIFDPWFSVDIGPARFILIQNNNNLAAATDSFQTSWELKKPMRTEMRVATGDSFALPLSRQWNFIQRETQRPGADWIFVLGHNPVISLFPYTSGVGGGHADAWGQFWPTGDSTTVYGMMQGYVDVLWQFHAHGQYVLEPLKNSAYVTGATKKDGYIRYILAATGGGGQIQQLPDTMDSGTVTEAQTFDSLKVWGPWLDSWWPASSPDAPAWYDCWIRGNLLTCTMKDTSGTVADHAFTIDRRFGK